jgi:phosphatidylglycerophosphate synthase
MLYFKRKYFNKLSKKIGITFSKLSLSPNQWTLSSLILVIMSFYFLVNQNFLIATIVFAFTISIDMIDGAVARATGRVTIFGGYLDTIIDRLIEFIIILGLFLNPYPDFILPMNVWLLFLIFGSLMVTYTKASAFEKGMIKKELKGGGILEHPDRLILILAIILISNFSMLYASYLIIITTILVGITTLQRFVIAIRG